MSTALLLGSVGGLAVGTYAIRLAGPLLRARVDLPPALERLAGLATLVLLAALVVTTTLLDGHESAGFARPAGVLVGAVLAWRRAPFVLVVVIAAGVAAGHSERPEPTGSQRRYKNALQNRQDNREAPMDRRKPIPLR